MQQCCNPLPCPLFKDLIPDDPLHPDRDRQHPFLHLSLDLLRTLLSLLQKLLFHTEAAVIQISEGSTLNFKMLRLIRGCREIAIFPLFRTKRRIPWKSCDLSHLFPRGILLILFVLSLLYYFYAHKKNIRFLFYELFFMLFSHLFFLRIFSTFHEGIDDICLYFGQLHTA